MKITHYEHFRHEELQDKLAQRRSALIPDAKTIAEIKHVSTRLAGKTALASIRLRRTLTKERFD